MQSYFRSVAIVSIGCILTMYTAVSVLAAGDLQVSVSLLRVEQPRQVPLSRLDLLPDNWGIAGARLGLEDNQTTGTFLGISFTLSDDAVTPASLQEQVQQRYAAGTRLFVVLANSDQLTVIADTYKDALVFNALSNADDLRNSNCRANILHVAPSYAMKADALAQYLLWKKWKKWFLVYGSHDDDQKIARSYKNAAKKFGATIVEEREFTDTQGSRRSDTGYVLVQKQIPVFTQIDQEYDVLVAADANEVFAGYLPYRTWEARPVAGSAGLMPVTWNAAIEAWGGMQFQRRFERLVNRHMREEDYQSWLALRIIGEAVVRTMSTDVPRLRHYMLSDDFEIAAFKGSKLNFRKWNGQLRQPVLLSDTHTNVSVSPQEGYLHQFSILDSLGFDVRESKCKDFDT